MTLRLAALMGLGTLGVHQLRYVLGYHGHADAALAATGHGYLASLVPAMAGVALLTLAAIVVRAAEGARAPAPRFARVWAGSTLGVLAVYGAQELAEGAPLAAHGGWVAVPAAGTIGLLIALVLRGAHAAGGLAAARRPWSAPTPLAPPVILAAAPEVARRSALPLRIAARGPPAVSV